MGYQLRMHTEIRAWLTGLRAAEPELARLVGEAVLAMADAGESLGPPLVIPAGSVLQSPDDPREALDYSYQRQLEALTKIRRGVADVATSRKRVELQVGQLEQVAARLASQRAHALGTAQQELASEARAREDQVEEQLSVLRRQLLVLTGEEEKLTAASQRLAAKVDAFRTRKETVKATYTAAEATQRIREAFADIDMDTGEPEAVDAEADAPPGPVDRGSILPPPGLMELRPGAPGNVRAGLLFVVEPQDTAVLLACVEDPGESADGYQEPIRIAAARLAAAQSDAPAAGAAPAALISYAPHSFLDEFFPGEETEVEIGAAALAARNRAHTLAEARQRMRLTQTQVARRMNVRQERVSAIERAEPGATEVRTLAAYVSALGGTLEIIAHIGGERVRLR
jgi:PspA/IM30 family/Helix-turn-helix domain